MDPLGNFHAAPLMIILLKVTISLSYLQYSSPEGGFLFGKKVSLFRIRMHLQDIVVLYNPVFKN